ncbi:MAG: hypothetical protein Q7S09_01695 [bacterium]|nr:hypothetical protein [bacterium]
MRNSEQIKKILVLLAIASLFIGAGLLLYRATKQGQTVYPESTNLTRSQERPVYGVSESGKLVVEADRPPVPEAVFSESGALPASFPNDLVVENDVIFTQSYRQDFAAEHYTYLFVEYYSRDSFKKNINYFSEYLKSRSWNIIRSTDEEGIFVAEAVRNEDGVKIVLTDMPQGVNVQLSYYVYGAAILNKPQ